MRRRSLGGALARGEVLGTEHYRALTDREPRIGYIVVSSRTRDYRSGVTNSSSLRFGAQELLDFLRENGSARTLGRLLEEGQGFAGEYLDVYAVSLFPAASGGTAPFGVVKVGYVVPGFPWGRGFERLWLYGTAAIGIIFLSLVLTWAASRRKVEPAPPAIEQRPLTDVDLEKGLKELDEALAEETTRVVDEFGREWKILFDGRSLEGWARQGEWYVTEEAISGQPWGASIVAEDLPRVTEYEFQFQAKRLAGPDGFVALFTCDAASLAWVIGGWGNDRAEVLGLEKTRCPSTVERNRWYKVSVRVEKERVEGRIDGAVVFSIPRSAVTPSSPDAGFQKGIGVAVWNTFAKFKDLRFLAL